MGRVFKPKYAWTKSDGTHVERVTEAWYIEYADANGRWVRRKAGLTKSQATDALRKAESDVLSEKNGIPTQRLGDILLQDMLKNYLTYLKPRVTDDHYNTRQQRIEDVISETRAVYLKDLTPEAMDKVLIKLDERNLAPRTVNYYLQAPKAMLNWAVRSRIIPYNPLDSVTGKETLERRRVRRALTEEEISRVLTAVKEGPLRRTVRRFQNRPRKDGTYKPADIPDKIKARMAYLGENNVLACRLMLEVGLRKSEAASVTWNDIDLAEGVLTTRPTWEGNKNGREETLPLTPGLADLLRQWRLRHLGSRANRIVQMSDRFLRHFYDDLSAAGLAKRIPIDAKGKAISLDNYGKPLTKPTKWMVDTRDESGRVLDLHALRHTFGTRLGSMPGIDPKSVQALMRHTDARLTFGVYVHSSQMRLKAVVATLPTIDAKVLQVKMKL